MRPTCLARAQASRRLTFSLHSYDRGLLAGPSGNLLSKRARVADDDWIYVARSRSIRSRRQIFRGAAGKNQRLESHAPTLLRIIDEIDSAKNHVGDRFEASLDEPVTVDGRVVVPKGASVYGRLEEAKTSGTFTGRLELRLALTGIVVNGQTVPLVSREYELSGKSRGASTAKRTVGGAAVGSIIGAIAGGGKGAAIGAGVGGAAGAGSEIITRGDQVKVPSETLLEFTLEQNVSIPVQQN
jgi:hypothetical protein